MYLYPGKREVKRKVRFLRQLWYALEMEVKTTLKKIVDPVAMSLVILEESKKLAKRVRQTFFKNRFRINVIKMIYDTFLYLTIVRKHGILND